MSNESPRRRIIPKAWMYHSILAICIRFLITEERSEVIVVESSRPPSSAGKGRILITPRLIDIIAMIRRIIFILIPISTISTIPAPIPIGPASIHFASSLSAGVAGIIRFFSVFPSTSTVMYESTYVSWIAYQNESMIPNLSWYSRLTLRFLYPIYIPTFPFRGVSITSRLPPVQKTMSERVLSFLMESMSS